MKSLTMISAMLAALMLSAGLAHADGSAFSATLSGDQEVVFSGDVFVPGGTDTDGFGKATADFNDRFSSVLMDLTVKNLTGSLSGAHLHCGRAGENGPVAFGLISPGPLTFDGRRIRGRLRNEDYTGADCVSVVGRPVNNIAALAAAMDEGLVYINVHTGTFAGGEIRGQMLEDEDDDDDDDSGGVD